MKLLDHIPATGLLPRMACRDKAEVVTSLVTALGPTGGITETADLVTDILRQEERGQTAIGRGLAVPHIRTLKVETFQIAVGTLERPLDIPAADDQPVDVFVLILCPSRDARQMLLVLARLARMVKTDQFLDDLRDAKTPQGMRDIIAACEAKLI